MLRAILFDFNGVLLDDEPIHLELFQRVLATEGIELSADDYYEHYLGFDDRDCFTAVLEAAGEDASPARLSRLIARKATYYLERLRRDGFPFFPGAGGLVREAGEAGLMMGIVSGALRDEIETALEELGVRDHFKAVVGAEDVEQGKPHPEGYRRGLELLNSLPPLPERLLHPHEVLAIEDSPAGIEAAAAAGLSTLGVAQTYPLSQLTAADHRIERVGDVGVGDLQRLFA